MARRVLPSWCGARAVDPLAFDAPPDYPESVFRTLSGLHSPVPRPKHPRRREKRSRVYSKARLGQSSAAPAQLASSCKALEFALNSPIGHRLDAWRVHPIHSCAFRRWRPLLLLHFQKRLSTRSLEDKQEAKRESSFGPQGEGVARWTPRVGSSRVEALHR